MSRSHSPPHEDTTSTHLSPKARNRTLIKSQISGYLDLSTPRLQNCQITKSMLFPSVILKSLNITLDSNGHYN